MLKKERFRGQCRSGYAKENYSTMCSEKMRRKI